MLPKPISVPADILPGLIYYDLALPLGELAAQPTERETQINNPLSHLR